MSNTVFVFVSISSTSETNTQKSTSFLTSNSVDAFYSQWFSSSISNDEEINDYSIKRRNLNETKNDISKSSLDGYMFNFKISLDVDHDISKHRLKYRNEPSSKITDMQYENSMIYNQFNNRSKLIDKVPLVLNKILVSYNIDLDKVITNNGN